MCCQRASSPSAAAVAYVNLQDDRGRTALHYGSEGGHMRVVDLLLINGADPTIRDNEGRTAEDLARANGHDEMADLLVNSH